MRAWQYPDYGPPESLVLVDAPRPEPGRGELLMRVRAASINPIDWKMRITSWSKCTARGSR